MPTSFLFFVRTVSGQWSLPPRLSNKIQVEDRSRLALYLRRRWGALYRAAATRINRATTRMGRAFDDQSPRISLHVTRVKTLRADLESATGSESPVFWS